MTYQEKLARFRQEMANRKLDALILFHTDPHQSEYLSKEWHIMPWLTGFTGSTGTVVITQNEAGVWTDSRYFIQGEKELAESGFDLMKLRIPHTPEYVEWLIEQLPKGGVIGVDGRLISINRMEAYSKKFKEKGIELLDCGGFLQTHGGAEEVEHVFDHSTVFTGKTREEKLQEIRGKMKELGVQHHLLTTLDDIAWVLNLRGNDISYNPVFVSYALISLNLVYLFVDEKKIPLDLRNQLSDDSIHVLPYGEIKSYLSQLPEGESLFIDAGRVNWDLFKAIPEHVKVLRGKAFSTHLKGVKNEVEQRLIREVMRRDGVALVKFFRWLEEAADGEGISEYEAGLQLEVFRGMQLNYVGPSFNPIVGYRGNGAIVHYRAPELGSSQIVKEGLLLVDSGGQYLDGTTDITRTVAMGIPTPDEKRDFTLVLKGYIGLDQAIFPEGTKGYQLESMARMPLWKHMKNYGHGTGHGVGFFLNVHEGPQSLGQSASGGSAVPLEVGMLTSNEPGFYLENKYGIRTENLVLCVEKGESEGYGKFLGFEAVTLFPIDLKLVEKSLLNQEEVDWLNTYHQQVWDHLSPALDFDEQIWLRNQCRQI
ncbi:MAG: aminopeptidase P family protein [Bacteroidota bacterium]